MDISQNVSVTQVINEMVDSSQQNLFTTFWNRLSNPVISNDIYNNIYDASGSRGNIIHSSPTMINMIPSLMPMPSPPNGYTFIPPTSIPISSIMEQSLYEKAKYKHIISSDGLKDILFMPYCQEDTIKCCPITREEFVEGEIIAVLPCKHRFNKEAILTWVKKKSANCPICRYQLDWVEEKDEPEEEVPRERRHSQRVSPSYYLTNLLTNIINERINEEEDRDVQQAIIASLQDN